MKLLLASLAVAIAALPSLSDDKDAQTLEHGRACCRRFYAGEAKELYAEFDDAMRKAIASEEQLKTFREQAFAQLGAETAIVDESVETQGPTRVYLRRARFEKFPGVIEVMFGFAADDKIAGFYVRPQRKEAPSEFLEYQTKTKLRLPFDGEWFVFWGGRTLAQNYHAISPDQRFAYDIMIMKDGASHSGEGKKNEDYHCFGRPIVAPGAGVVVVAIDGIDDNVPGEMNPRQAAGNHVIVDHENGEFSLLAHFKKGSLKVKPGDKVAVGAPLGLCGNSGNSSEPHLHFHMQNAGEFGKGAGLPAQFEEYVANGEPVARGEPVKGERIRVP